MTVEQNFIQLENGGSLAVAEYGDPKGTPVIFCHGWPSSSGMAELTDAAGRELGVRIISPDRPGINGSTLQPERTLKDWLPIVRQLVDHYQIDKFHMLAISGGAPYAFITGREMPERVQAITVVSGAPPLAELTDQRGLLPLYRGLMIMYARYPGVLRHLFRWARPFVSVRSTVRMAQRLWVVGTCDAAALRDSAAFNICFESQRLAWRHGAEGVMSDARIYGEPWGFRLEDVRVPVRLWHGKRDRSFAWHLAEEIERRLPNCTARYVENSGHYSLPIRNMREILADLISI